MVSPLRRVTFSLLVQRESNQRESTPGIRVWLRQTSLAPALLRGSSRWAIPGPSFLVWHPCQTPLSTTPPLGLLTGFGDRVVWAICGRQKAKASRVSPALRVLAFHPQSHRQRQTPHQEAEWNRCGRERAAWMRREAQRARDGPCTPAPGAMMERGKSSAARPACKGQDFLLTFGAFAKSEPP